MRRSKSFAEATRRSSAWARRARASWSPRTWPTPSAEPAGDDVVPQALCRCVRAKLIARHGEADRAVELAREATAMVEGMDFPDLQALTLLSLAEVLDAAGKGAESEEISARAQALYEKKGNVAAGRRMVSEINPEGRPQ